MYAGRSGWPAIRRFLQSCITPLCKSLQKLNPFSWKRLKFSILKKIICFCPMKSAGLVCLRPILASTYNPRKVTILNGA